MSPTRQQVRAEARSSEFRDVTARFAAEPRPVRRRIAGKRARTSWKQLASALGMTPGAAVGPRARRVTLVLTAFAAFTTISALTPPQARAQGSRKDDIVFNTRGVPLAGASVRVCAMPASGQPCTPLALIYSDAALTQALANPTGTDGLGNYFFFAAPGKYLIEISGPGIITKQFPNVILPSDPTSPTFSSITSTSGISGFSLTLTGNLTVNGSASVVGNLGFGTAQLANQATPPGAAPSGTVNLYTKTADKRLYYKDDTGTEIGPIANTTGAQTNVGNTFTADQSIDASLRIKGPAPWIDVTRYGVRSLTNPAQSTTATTTAGSASVTLPGGAADFINGDGFMVLGAGPACPSLQTPNQLTIAAGGAVRSGNVVTITTTQRNDYVFPVGVGQTATIAGVIDSSFNGTFAIASVIGNPPTQFTYSQTAVNATSGGGTAQNLAAATLFATPHGLLNGSTTIQYQAIAENTTGCLSAASPVITTTAGPAALGLTTINISTVSRTNGIVTVTTTANHNLEAKISQVKLNTGSPFNFDGTFTVFSTPTATTFTFKQLGVPDLAAVSGGTVQVAAQVWVKWLHVDPAARNYWVYRKIGAGAWTLAGPTQSSEPFYEDFGWGTPSAPAYVPATPPTVAQNAPLVTTIASGGGTTNLVLANAATSSVTAQPALHDNSVGFIAALTAAGANNGGLVYFPPTITVGGNFAYYYFNSPSTVLPSVAAGAQITIQVAGPLALNGPLFLPQLGPTGYSLEGVGGFQGPQGSFPMTPTVTIAGSGYPLLQLENASNFRMSRICLNASLNQQHALVAEPNLNGGGVTNLLLRDNVFAAASNQGGVPAFFHGTGFNTQIDGNNLFNATNAAFYSPGAIHGATYDIGNSAGGNGLAISSISNITLLGGGIVMENDIGVVNGNLAGNFHLYKVFGESQTQPFFRLNTNGAFSQAPDWTIDEAMIADSQVGQATPAFDLGGSNASISNLTVRKSQVSPSGAMFEAGTQEPYGVFIENNTTNYVGLNVTGYLAVLGQTNVNTGDGNGATVHTIIEDTAPVRVKFGGSIFFENSSSSLPTITSVTAAAGGSVSAGLRNYQIVGIDDTGAQTQPGPAFSFTVAAGNQTITVNWTGMPGFTNYGVIDGATGQFAAGCNNVAGLTCTYSQAFSGGGPPSYSATGSNRINANGVYGTKLTVGSGTALAKYSRFAVSLSPAAVGANTCAAQSFTVTGLVAGDILIGVNKPTEQVGLSIMPGHVTGANTATLNFCNHSGAGITPTAAETYSFVAVQ